MADYFLGFKFPKTVKIAFYKHVRASANGLKTNDVIGLQSLGGQAYYL